MSGILPGFGPAATQGGGLDAIVVMVSATAATNFPAGTNYVSVFSVDGGDGGNSGDGFNLAGGGGRGSDGGTGTWWIDVPKGSHTAVYCTIPAAAARDTDAVANTIRWDSSGGTTWALSVPKTPDAVFPGGNGSAQSQFSTGGGKGGGAGGPYGNGVDSPDSGSVGAGGPKGLFQGDFDAAGITNNGGGQIWGGGGNGGSASSATNGQAGGKGGVMLVFSAAPLAAYLNVPNNNE